MTAARPSPAPSPEAPPGASTGLAVQGLTKTFADRTVVEDLTFRVRPGAMTGFLGSNGAGKTTSMRMIMGLLDPDRGELLWNGRPLTAEDRADFGYMPEERGLYPKQKITDQLVYLGQLHGMDRAEARERTTELLETFGLADRAADKLESLSLGNQQRVQIAAALVHDPVCLVLDEPFSGLDPAAVDSMVGLLGTYLRRGVSVLFSSHQLDLVERLCEDVVILDEGRVMAAGAAEELREAGPVRYRLVAEEDAGWLRSLPGLEVVDLDHTTALVEFPDPDRVRETREAVLAEGLRRGLTEFARVRPTLGQIYREVTR